jgi:hypothetical protein
LDKEHEQEQNIAEEVKLLREELARYKNQAEDIKILKQNAEETKMLKVELDKCKTKLQNITKPRVKNRTKEEMEILKYFIDEHIIYEKGSLIKTADVMTKANEALSRLNIRFNKFEIAQFMKDRGAEKKKGQNYTYYTNLKFV